MTIKAEEGRWW